MEFKGKKELGITYNKKMVIKDIFGIHIHKFRMFEDQEFHLGKNITVVSGRNGTMKSTVMGLLAQPYRSEEKNLQGKKMETKFSDVFKLSAEKDQDDYLYDIMLNINDNLSLKEPIPLYFQPGNPNSKTSQKDRHRLVPSGRSKGDGYFTLPSVYINLKRLFPLTESNELRNEKVKYTKKEEQFISNFFEKVLLRSDFNSFEKYNADDSGVNKRPYGPSNSFYDVHSISSGEDNLSTFVDVLIAFVRIYEENQKQSKNSNRLTGLFSIDEFEASLHPVAQLNLFQFLLDWSKKYNVKIVMNTHSLFLIQSIYLNYASSLDKEEVIVNFIATQFEADKKLKIYRTPAYQLAYEELTLSKLNDDRPSIKVKVLCEDEEAVYLMKRIIKKQSSLKYIEFSHIVNENNNGTSYVSLATLCKSFPKILKETRSIVVFDAEVDCSKLKLGNYDRTLQLPSRYGFPIEKEIVRYIIGLSGNHAFFKKYDKTKEIFKQEFSAFDIPLDGDSEQFKQAKTKLFKNWFNGNKRNARKYITYYVDENRELFDSFKNDLGEMVDQMRQENGLPIIDDF